MTKIGLRSDYGTEPKLLLALFSTPLQIIAKTPNKEVYDHHLEIAWSFRRLENIMRERDPNFYLAAKDLSQKLERYGIGLEFKEKLEQALKLAENKLIEFGDNVTLERFIGLFEKAYSQIENRITRQRESIAARLNSKLGERIYQAQGQSRKVLKADNVTLDECRKAYEKAFDQLSSVQRYN